MEFDKTQLERYEKYLEWFNSFIERCFDNQKEYIFCKKGCSKCCKQGEFPISELEFQYLSLGFDKLDLKFKKEVYKKIEKLKNRNEGELYECPLLDNDVCSIYPYRSLICRSYGLLWYKEEKIKAPFCIDHNMNFSRVLDKETGKILDPEILGISYKNKPVAYNLSLDTLTKNKMCADIEFGKKRALIDFLADYTKDNKAY